MQFIGGQGRKIRRTKPESITIIKNRKKLIEFRDDFLNNR